MMTTMTMTPMRRMKKRRNASMRPQMDEPCYNCKYWNNNKGCEIDHYNSTSMKIFGHCGMAEPKKVTIPEDIKKRIFEDHECLNMDFTGRNNIANYGVVAEDEEVLFFLKETTFRYVFCRMKLPGEMTEKDFFEINKGDFEQMYEEGKVNFY